MIAYDVSLDINLEIRKKDERLICKGAGWLKEFQLELGGFGLSLIAIEKELVYSLLQKIETTRASINERDPLFAVEQYRLLIRDMKTLIHDDYLSAILLLMPLSGQLAISNRNVTLIRSEDNERRMIQFAIDHGLLPPTDPIFLNRDYAQERLANDKSGYEALYRWTFFLQNFEHGFKLNEVADPLVTLNGAKAHLDLICVTLAELDKIQRMLPLYLNRDNAQFFLVSEQDRWLTEVESFVNEIKTEHGTRIRCDSLLTTLAGEQQSLRESRRYIHTCQVCGRYFFNAYPDAKYCSGYAPQKPEVLCKDFGKTMVIEKRDQMLGYHDLNEARKRYAKWKHSNLERIDQIIHENVDNRTVDIPSFMQCKSEIQKLYEAWKEKASQALRQYNEGAISQNEFLLAIKVPSFTERGPLWNNLKKAWSKDRTKNS